MKQCGSESELRLKCISVTRVASNLGMTGSGIIVGLFHLSKFYILFYISSVALLFSAIFCYFFVVENRHNYVELNDKIKVILPLQNSISRQIVFLMLIFLFVAGLLISQLSVTYPIYIQESFPQLGTKGVSLLFIISCNIEQISRDLGENTSIEGFCSE